MLHERRGRVPLWQVPNQGLPERSPQNIMVMMIVVLKLVVKGKEKKLEKGEKTEKICRCD